jgi:acylphosphatase
MVRVRAVVSGRVQGVWFRQSCREQAVAAGVAGWVRNRPDGRVEAELEGEQAAVDVVLAWLEEGPPLAVVTGVEVTDEAPSGQTGFEVR